VSKPLRSRLGLALVLLPVLGQFLVVGFLGVNTPAADEFAYVDFVHAVREGGPWLPMVWWQHNEHRVVPVKLVMALLMPFTGWNLKAEMYVSAALAGLIVLGLWRLYRRAGGADLLLFAPVAWLVCNLAQYENLLYGLLMCHYFTAAGTVWALVFLARRDAAGLFLAVLCGLVASLSVLNGLLIWPLGLALGLALGERPARMIGWAGAGVATFLLYFFDFQRPPGLAAPHLQELPRAAKYALTLLGAPLAAGSFAWSRTFGLALVCLMAAVVVRWLREGRERLRGEAIPAALILFGLLSCAMIAIGRAATLVTPLESRYVAYTSLAFVGAYLLAGLAAERRGAPFIGFSWFAATLALVATGVIAADLQGFHDAKLWQIARLRDQFLLQTYERQPDEALGGSAFAAHLRATAPYLRTERLAAFAEPQRVLLLTRWQEREAAGPVAPGRSIEQRLSCPVNVLRDAAVALSREAAPDASNVSISVWTSGRRLAARDLPVTALASGWVGWVEVPLPAPLYNCQGRVLTVRIESRDATPATQITVWIYPSYYDGELRQAGRSWSPDRSLGLSLNAFHFGLLR